jgi:hypothetical protein
VPAWPWVQFKHTNALTLLYVPPGQIAHADAPKALVYVPAGHGTPLLELAPTPQYQPGEAKHASVQPLLVIPAVLPYLPAGQGLHASAPAVLYMPTSHAPLVVLSAVALQREPAGHGIHAPMLPLGESVPTGQGTGVLAVAPLGQ